MKYNLCKTITAEQLGRAYELLATTDLTHREVARALMIKDERTLKYVIVHAEDKGLYQDEFRPLTVGRMILKYLQARRGKAFKPQEIADFYSCDVGSFRNSLYNMLKRNAVKRRKLYETKNKITIYGYYLEVLKNDVHRITNASG